MRVRTEEIRVTVWADGKFDFESWQEVGYRCDRAAVYRAFETALDRLEGKREGRVQGTYTLWLECYNCGFQWQQTLPYGKEFFPAMMVNVNGGGLLERPWEAHYGVRGEHGLRTDKDSVILICPNCGSSGLDRKGK